MMCQKKKKRRKKLRFMKSQSTSLLRSAMTDLFLAAYCDSFEFSLNSVRLVSSNSL